MSNYQYKLLLLMIIKPIKIDLGRVSARGAIFNTHHTLIQFLLIRPLPFLKIDVIEKNMDSLSDGLPEENLPSSNRFEENYISRIHRNRRQKARFPQNA